MAVCTYQFSKVNLIMKCCQIVALAEGKPVKNTKNLEYKYALSKLVR
jgi:hypothetical protein